MLIQAVAGASEHKPVGPCCPDQTVGAGGKNFVTGLTGFLAALMAGIVLLC